MDFAAHNITLEYLLAQGRLKQYKYVILLNSSVRGPFVPSYMPEGWQWPQAYTSRLVGDVHVVSSSLVCLPEVDLGEAWGCVCRVGLLGAGHAGLEGEVLNISLPCFVSTWRGGWVGCPGCSPLLHQVPER